MMTRLMSGRHRRATAVGLFLLMVFAEVVMFQSLVGAAPTDGPNPDFTLTAGRELNYLVSRDTFTNIAQSDFEIYSEYQSVTLRIYSPNICTNSTTGRQVIQHTVDSRRMTDEIIAAGTNATNGSNVTGFRLFDPDSSAQTTYNGRFLSTTNAACGSGNWRDMTINAAGKVRDMTIGPTGMYKYRFTATMTSGMEGLINGFRLRVRSDAGAIISQVPGTSNFGIQVSYPRGSGYTNFKVPFGADCTIGGPVSRTIRLWDLDSTDTDVQPTELRVRLYGVNQLTGTGGYVPMSASGSGVSMSGPDASNYYDLTAGNLTTAALSFTARPDYRYELQFENAYYENTLQLAIPFSSVWYYKLCMDNYVTVEPQLDISPSGMTIGLGQSYTADFNVLKNNTVDAELDTERLVWLDDGDGIFEASDSTIVNTTANGVTVVGNGTQTVFTTNDSVNSSALPKICFQWTITSADALTIVNTSGGVNTVTECLDIGKSPSTHVLGNDVRVGSTWPWQAPNRNSKIRGTLTTLSGEYFGSWAEYGALAPALIEQYSTNSAAANGHIALPSEDAARYELAFSNNIPSVGLFAPESEMGKFPNVVGYFFENNDPQNTNKKDINGVTIPNASVASVSGNFSNSQVRYSNGGVQINNNITYNNPGSFGSVDDMPQLVIIAEGDINISQSVTQIDAWLISINGTIDDCRQVSGTITISDCTLPLTINGPIMAPKLLLKRTAGSTSSSTLDDAAETINMPASAYIWAHEVDRANGIFQTTSTTELPPRL